MFPAVGFCGSRSLAGASFTRCGRTAAALAALGVPVSVGCAAGADLAVRLAVPGCSVFSVASGAFGSGRSAFAARSSALVRSLPPGSAFVGFPGGPCPPGVVPASSWRSGSPPSGSWSALALAAGLGLAVFVFDCPRPAWGGQWQPVHSGGRVFPIGGFRFVPAQGQLSLF